jgi:hypothetical protein
MGVAGVVQFHEPKRIRFLTADGRFAMLDGSDTRLPVAELILQAKPDALNNTLSKKAIMREDIFSLTEGQVKIQWPTPLSKESIQDLKDWLNIVERKIARSVAAPETSDESQLEVHLHSKTPLPIIRIERAGRAAAARSVVSRSYPVDLIISLVR